MDAVIPERGCFALDVADVHVWYLLTTSLDDAAVDRALEILSREERLRCRRFRFARDRRDYAIAHGLLRRCLSRYHDVPPAAWSFEAGLWGKPSLSTAGHRPGGERQPPSFNLSHTRGLVACGITPSMPIGIDVEYAGRPIDVAERLFSPGEIASLARCSSVAHAGRVVDLWTLKEAYLKATDRGLSQHVNAVSFDLDEPGSVRFCAAHPCEASQWHFAVFAPTPASRLAVAAHGASHPRFTARAFASSRGDDWPLLRPLRTCCDALIDQRRNGV